MTIRLRLLSAVIIQSLSQQQVQHYVEQAGAALAGLRTVLQADEHLWELLKSPLMLSIMALAYQGRSAEEIPATGTLENRRTHVLATYTDAMFARRAKISPYTREQTEHWLTWLAQTMQDHNQSIFYLEWMQPDWLPGQRQQRLVTFATSILGGLLYGLLAGLQSGLQLGLQLGLLYGLLGGLGIGLFAGPIGGLSVGIRSPFNAGLIGGLLYGLLVGLGIGLFVGPLGGLLGGLSFGLLGALVCGLFVWLVGYAKEIKPVEKLRWSWSNIRAKWIKKLCKRLAGGLAVALVGGLAVALVSGIQGGLLGGLAFGLRAALSSGLFYGLCFGLLGALLDGFTEGNIGTQSFPNEGIKRSMRNASISGLTLGLFSGLLGWLTSGLFSGLQTEGSSALSFALSLGQIGGWIGGLRFGGRTCLRHFALRLVLWYKNFAPLNYIRFLDYATARIFLRKVGGGYVFVHRMLLEYFATIHQKSAE